jgi:16S rRNA (cytosine967-C5)-methyltransferase
MDEPSKNSPAPGQAARNAAAVLLDAVLSHGAPLDEAIAGNTALAALAPRDRGFARMLTATVLRRLGEIDAVLDACLDKPLPRRAAPAYQALRLGACQLLFLGTPPHAAVDGAVRMAARRAPPFRGLVNAVLRRIARDGESLTAGLDPDRLNQADWLWQSWVETYGEDGARAIAAAHRADPPLDLTVAQDASGWAEKLGGVVLPTGGLRLQPAGPIPSLPGFAEGAWWVQDAAAALPARLLAGALDGGLSARKVIDLCAAPGGKTAQLAAAGAMVTAVDRNARRLGRLRENLERLKLRAETIAADAGSYKPAQPADAVLLDAPCTATGTIRRHPDIAWLKKPGDVTSLAGRQAQLLEAALAMLSPGGVLIYAVCSLQPEEGPAQVDALLSTGGAIRIPIMAEEVPGLSEALTETGDLRTLPSHLPAEGGIDGFYIARLKRV